MKDILFMLADLLMIAGGLYCGWKFLRDYGNWLLGLEWIIVGSSGVNFLVWALRGGDQGNFQYDLAFFLDAFSRSVGITLIAVVGLMQVTHKYKPRPAVDVGLFALAIVAGLYLQQFSGHELHVGPATFYVVVNLLTTAFLLYFIGRVWSIGAKGLAVWTALATAAGTAIAVTYDFFPIPGDDANRTIFYTAALATWGAQLFVFFFAYRALHDHNEQASLGEVTAARGHHA
jgi:hypothetical protein